MTNHGNTGKKNALKEERDKLTSQLQIRCKQSDKALWVKAAGGEKLSVWVTRILIEQARLALNEDNKTMKLSNGLKIELPKKP